MKRTHVISGTYLSIFDQIKIQTDSNNNRKYIEPPVDILELDYDNGIEFIGYDIINDTECKKPEFADATFNRTSLSDIPRLYYNPHETPSPKNVFFYIVGSRIYFVGLENVNVKYLEGGFVGAINPNTLTSFDTKIELDSRLMETLITQVISLGYFALRVPKDRKNDGTETEIQQPVKTPPQPVNVKSDG
jgi:hypothetical protein